MLVALGAAGGFAYVYKLKADNAILKANQEKLETAVQEQQELLEVKELEYQYIIEKSKELEEKLGFIDLIITMAYSAKCNYIDTFGMVKYWETIIYNFLKEQNIQTPPQRLKTCLLYTSPSPRDKRQSRMPSSA